MLVPSRSIMRSVRAALHTLSLIRVAAAVGTESDDYMVEKIFDDFPGGQLPFQQNTSEHGPGGPVKHCSLGQLFSVTIAGHITGVRFFANAREANDHDVFIWRADGTMAANSTIPASSFGRAYWVDFPITPVAIEPGVEYMVNTQHSCAPVCHWAGGVHGPWSAAGSNGGHIRWPASSARYCNGNGHDCMRKMPMNAPGPGETYFRDITFCPASAPGGVCAPLPPPPPSPHAAKVIVSGASFIARPSAAANHVARRSATFTASVVDQYGKPMPDFRITNWTLTGAPPSGVTILPSEDMMSAAVTVDSTMTVDKSVSVVASAGGSPTIVGTKTVRMERLAPAGISVCGPAAASLNGASATTLSYTTTVRDQRGHPIIPATPWPSIAWSITPPVPGVSVNSSGVVTVAATAVVCTFTLAATSGPMVNGSIAVRLEAFDASFFLSTLDTAITVVVKSNQIWIASLINPAAGWDFASGDTQVPLPVAGNQSAWQFSGFTNSSDGERISEILSFTSGDLRLESIWVAGRTGGGPITNAVRVENTGIAPAVYDSSIRSADLHVETSGSTSFHAFSKTGAGPPEAKQQLVSGGLEFTLPCGGPTSGEGQFIPLGMLNVEDAYGMYVGFEWELGAMTVNASTATRLSLTAGFLQPGDQITIATGAATPEINCSFTAPAVYYGAYWGDIDGK